MAITDIVIVIIVLFSVYLGYQRGFLASLLGFFGIFLTGFLTIILYSPIAQFLLKTPLYDLIYQNTLKWIVQNPSMVDKSDFPIPIGMLKIFGMNMDAMVNNFKTGAAQTITTYIIYIISIILVFISAYFLSKVLLKLAKGVNNIIIVGFVNKVLGFVMGFLQAYLIIYLVLALVIFILPLPKKEVVQKEISKSEIVKVIKGKGDIFHFFKTN